MARCGWILVVKLWQQISELAMNDMQLHSSQHDQAMGLGPSRVMYTSQKFTQ